MRERPAIWKKIDAFNYLGVVATEILGWQYLTHLPELLRNYRSILDLPDVQAAALAIQNLRHLNLGFATRDALRRFALDYRDYHDRRERNRLHPGEDFGCDRRFLVDDDLAIGRNWRDIVPDDVRNALAALRSPLPLALSDHDVADPLRPAYVEIGKIFEYAGEISPLSFRPLSAPRHDLSRTPRGPIEVSWAELLAEAREMDSLDRERRLPPGNWESRLVDAAGEAKVRLLAPASDRSRLVAAPGLIFSGVKHLIGLPGAGKSTLLYLLARWLARNGYRALFLFPSIEVGSAFIERLEAYDVHVGLLMGQSPVTRIRHMMRLAEGLAAGRPNGGFGATRPIARLMGSTCALAGFANPPHGFPHLEPPCLTLRQAPEGKMRPRDVLCHLAGMCGRNRAPRELVDAPLWAGHIMSSDSQISPLFADQRLHYFELVARCFDLVVIDEADGAQAMLDEQGAAVLNLSGASDSFHASLIRDLHSPIAHGSNQILMTSAVRDYSIDAARFEDLNLRLVTTVQELGEPVKSALKDQLITTERLFAELFPIPEDIHEEERARLLECRSALEAIWEACAKNAIFDTTRDRHNDDDEDTGLDLPRIAKALGCAEAAVDGLVKELLAEFRSWLTADSASTIDLFSRRALERFANFAGLDRKDRKTGSLLAILLAASFVILQYIKITPRVRGMVSLGVHRDDIIQPSPSAEMTRLMPESMLGRLSGVRYRIEKDAQSRERVAVQYLSFSSAPRMLLYRWHELYAREGRPGPAVLLTSATSFLEPSPGYHIAVGPDYALKRTAGGEGWSRSRYALLPLEDRRRAGAHLRFSGAPFEQKDRILRDMVRTLLADGERSIVAREMAHNDVRDGIGRKAAFVVNSYDQVETVKDEIDRNFRDLASRTRAVVRTAPTGPHARQYLTAAQAESLGADDDWDLLVFPMAAIGRGVNIVFPDGPRKNDAKIGCLYFLTRPHPTVDSLTFVQALAGRASMDFDLAPFPPGTSLAEALQHLNRQRAETMTQVRQLLRHPIAASRLGPLARPFTADNMIAILQTIGRAMRNDCPAFVYFVDAAWAPRSAKGEPDTVRTSMLVLMRDILEECLSDPDPVRREIYEELYRPFLDPLSRVDGLVTSQSAGRAA